MRNVMWVVLASMVGGQAGADERATVYEGGLVWQGPGRFAEALCVKGEKLAEVGAAAAVRAACPAAARIALKGAVVVPALRDVHEHIGTAPGLVANPKGEDNPGPARVCELARRARASMALTDTRAVVVMASEKAFRARAEDGSFVLTRQYLDGCGPTWPVIVAHQYGHGKVVNSLTDKLVGVSTAPAVDWGWVETPGGVFNGRFHEGKELQFFEKAFERVSAEQLADSYVRFARFALPRGLASVGEMATGMGHVKAVNALVEANRRLGPAAMHWESICLPLTASSTCLMVPEGKELVATGGFKFFVGPEWLSKSSMLSQPYVGDNQRRGRLDYTPEALRERIRPLLKLPVGPESKLHLHATTDSEVAAALDALDALGGPAVWKQRRVSIEHAHVVPPALLERLVAYAPSITITGNHLTIEEDGQPIIHRRLPTSLIPFTERLASFRARGLNLAAGADAFDVPEATDDDSPHNPWANIAAFVAHPGRPSERLSLDEALVAYTSGAAWASFAEKRTGTLARGMDADFTVLEQNPWKVPVSQLKATRARLVVVKGRTAYDAARP